MSHFRLTAAIAAAITAGVFLQGCSRSGSSVDAASAKAERERHQAPDFALKDADGRWVRLSDYRGKVVLLDFWATWCPPCKIEIPWFIDLERKDKDRGLAVLGVSMDDEGWDVVRPFLSQVGVNYPVVIGDDRTAESYGGIDALPTTFLIDRTGRIAAVHVGLASRKDFEDGVERLLQAPAPGSGDRASVPATTASTN